MKTLPMINKGQSSIEYVTTYGWMLLAVSIAAATAYNVIDISCTESFQGFYTDTITVNDYGVDVQDQFVLSLTNERYTNLTITQLNITDGNTNKTQNTNQLIQPGQKRQITLPGFTTADSCTEMNIKLTYNKEQLTNQTLAATMKAPIKMKQ